MTIRIAMWSGPRTISTAMMRAWENRTDTAVWDEPLYPLWLSRNDLDHPGRAHVLKAQAADLDAAALCARLGGDAPGGEAIFYQKHMAHHLMDDLDLTWLQTARHAFLLRRPDRMLASLARKYPAAGIADTGLPQQMSLLHRLDAMGLPSPPVIDSDAVLAAPGQMLRALCRALEVPFDDAMCQWPSGPRDSDGSWASWWYESVNASTGWGPPRTDNPDLPPAQLAILPECRALYAELAELSIAP